MKRIGFEKARARLRDAFVAHEELKAAQDWQSFESAWTRLLTSLNSVYSILGQSVRGSAKSERWFADAKQKRKADEVLSYLHHARNANDHGITEIVCREPGGIGVGGRRQPIHIEKLAFDGSKIRELKAHSLDGSPLIITRYPERVSLVPVVDRGVEYHPPTMFLGKPLADNSPTGVATKVLEFMVILFSDAEELLVTS